MRSNARDLDDENDPLYEPEEEPFDDNDLTEEEQRLLREDPFTRDAAKRRTEQRARGP